MRLSLCICTMNRAADLRKCLASIRASSAQPHEVIVSDDSRAPFDEETRAAASEFPEVTYVRGPRRGLSANRNNCLRTLTGDLVAFVDDDVVLERDFLGASAREFERLSRERGTEKIIVTGYEIRPEGRVGSCNVTFHGTYGVQVRPGQPLNAICINSTVFPAALFREARFDENIFFGAEERDISFHARWLGYQIVYSEALVNYHFPSPVNRDLYNKVAESARYYFCLKRHGIYERSVRRLLLYLVWGPVKEVGFRLKRAQFRDAWLVLGAFSEALRKYRTLRSSGAGPSGPDLTAA